MDSIVLENKNQAINRLEQIKRNITFIFNEIESASPESKEVYRSIINKVFIVDLYTVWEQFVKKCVGDVYDKYKNVIFTDVAIMKRILNENIKRARVINFNDDGSVKFKELLIASNNIRYFSFKNIVLSIGFDINRLANILKQDEKIKLRIREIKISGVSLLRDKDEKETELQDIANSIYTIVNLRNEYAHTGNVNQFFNKEQMISFCNLFFSLLDVIYVYVSEELCKKIYRYYLNHENSIKINVLDVLYENKPRVKQYSTSLRISSRKKVGNINDYSFFIEYRGDCYKAEKVKIENCNQQEINDIEKGEQFIVVNTSFNVRKNKDIINLYIFSHKTDYANIRLG